MNKKLSRNFSFSKIPTLSSVSVEIGTQTQDGGCWKFWFEKITNKQLNKRHSFTTLELMNDAYHIYDKHGETTITHVVYDFLWLDIAAVICSLLTCWYLFMAYQKTNRVSSCRLLKGCLELSCSIVGGSLPAMTLSFHSGLPSS